MVNPIYIFIIALGVGFLLSLFDKLGRNTAIVIFFAALAGMTFISGQWFFSILQGNEPLTVFTAGFKPPYSINLQMGLEESFFTLMSNFLGLLSGIYLIKKLKEEKVYAMILYLMLIMGINGLIMTRDLFNLFVFLEITSIATFSIIGIERNLKSLSAGFKYMIAGGIASSFFLIGTIYLYRLTGTLNIDFMIAAKGMIAGKAGFVALFIMFSAIIIELKPYPANGWALDVYESVNDGIVTIIAAASSGALFFVLHKLLPLLNTAQYPVIAGIGLTTFVFSNLIGLKQDNAKRLLGFSSIAQIGLLITAYVLLLQVGVSASSKIFYLIVGGIFINHFIAKAGLFWLAGIIKKEKTSDWKILQSKPILLVIFGVFILGLAGLPPFPGFFAKFQLILLLLSKNMNSWVWFILIGSLLEAVYLLRWFGYAVKNENNESFNVPIAKAIPVVLFAVLLFVLGYASTQLLGNFNLIYLLPVAFAIALYFLDWLPAKIKAILTMVIIGIYSWYVIPLLGPLQQLFAAIFLIGGVIQIIGTMNSVGQRKGFYPLLGMLILSLGNLLTAETFLQFFLAWEFMTISSYLLVLKGKDGQKPALSYIIFSLAGAFLILAGFGYAYASSGSILLTSLANAGSNSTLVYILLSIGFLIKTGTAGVHIWLPGSYAESEDDFSPIISSVLSKAGIFGLFIVGATLGAQKIGNLDIAYIIGWMGVITAFFGALFAAFQEDIKKLLAYSSMGQVGYIVLSMALLSHLGWVTALYVSFNHLFFKAILFISVAGIISRVKTRKMYEMGGLIKTMPFSFIAVLIAIIAVSGVPPLTGFGAKWMLYVALIEKGWGLQAGLAFFASAIAFLYLFRLIHTMFLGQPKPEHKNIKEASLWYLIPSFIFIIIIMVFSMYPNLLIKPIMTAVETYFPATIHWEGNTVITSLGYWNGNAVMMVTMGVFMTLFVLLILRIKSVWKVKQFNIVYAAERPDTPATTHIAHNFFAPYQKALGFLAKPNAKKFWNDFAEWIHSLGAVFRNFYTGNGQTYAFHIILYIVIIYFIMGVK